MAEREVGIAGDGPAADAVAAAIEDTDAAATRIDADEVGTVDVAAVVGRAGDAAFDRANRAAEAPWLAVELGGIGGHALPEVDAAVSLLGPGGRCLDCLRGRVRSNLEEPPDAEPRTARSDARLAGAHAGRLAVAVLAGEAEPGRVLELPYAERRLLPLPGCDCGAAPERGLERDHEEVELEAAIDRGDPAIDDRLGIVAAIGEAHSFPVPYYLATLADTSGFSDATVGRQAAGAAVDWNAAFMKAIGESLERYAAGVYRESTFRRAAADDLDDAVPPAAFVRPDEGYREPDPDAEIGWVPGEDLATGESVHLPAEFAVFPPPAERHKPPITTGLGLGASTVDALLAGLYEVIERDAAMLAWYSTFEPLELEVEDGAFATLRRRARGEDLDATALLVTQDVDVPVVTAAVHRDEGWPQFAVGSSAHLDPDRAARGALAEALQNWTELRALGAERAAEEETAIGRYAEFPPAARSFVDVEGSVASASVAPDATPSGTAELDAVLERAGDAGLDAYGVRLTTRDVDALGFEVVRVLAPAAQPLFTDERYFGERVRRVPRDLGFRPRLDRPPHPYP